MISRSLRALVVSVSAAFVLASSMSAHAQDPNRSGRRFFARGALGPGYVKLENDNHDLGLKLDHVGGYWDLAAGITAYKGLAIHGTYFGGFAYNPDVTQDGKIVNGVSKTSLTVLGIGPGATYHIYPVNLYVSYSAGLGVSVLRFHGVNDVGTAAGWSNFGFANEFVIGKEWWIGNGLAVGFGVQVLYARVTDEDPTGNDVHYHSFGGSALFSSSYH